MRYTGLHRNFAIHPANPCFLRYQMMNFISNAIADMNARRNGRKIERKNSFYMTCISSSNLLKKSKQPINP